MTPNARTAKWLRDHGWVVDYAERRLPGNRTRDLFGFVDLVAVREGRVLFVQATSDNGGNLAARIRKVRAATAFREIMKLPVWSDVQISVIAIGWKAPRKVRGRTYPWTPRGFIIGPEVRTPWSPNADGS